MITADVSAFPNALVVFHTKMCALLDGEHSSLSSLERRWFSVFRAVASQYYRALPEDQSFQISFDALRRCFRRKNARYRNYLLRACRNAHIDYLRPIKAKFQRLANDCCY